MADLSPGPAEAMSADLLDRLPCGVAFLDLELRILSVNRYFRDLVGGSGPGRLFHSHLSVAGRIFLQSRLQQELGVGGLVEERALDLIRADGVRVPVMLNASQGRGLADGPEVIHITLWRAVASRAYEAEVPRARLAAEVAAVAKQDFLANISHEIRTPLNGVIGIAGALRSTSLTQHQLDMVDLIVSSGTVLERLVSDVLDLSKAQAGELTLELRDVDLRTELVGVIQTARLAAGNKGLTFSFDVTPGSRLYRTCDSVRLRQILGNLLSNAVKFTSNGSVDFTIAEDGDALLFTVTDDGIGFDETIGATLFERFHQADTSITRRYGGTGLGLSICKALVGQMKGDIQARSSIGEGSRFEVRLPLPIAKPVSVGPEPSGPTAPLSSLKILLVEDNPTNQRVVEMILNAVGAELSIAADGLKGVEAWQAQHWDLILMDMQMPVMDGLSAVRRIRALEAETGRHRTPIAMLSANAMLSHLHEGIEAGADHYITKPVTPTRLFSGMDETIQKSGTVVVLGAQK